jgi:hypothetical protein
MMQVNKTIAELNLTDNELGPEGGKAIATSLQVTFPFLLLAPLDDIKKHFTFLFAGQHIYHQSKSI